jgi:signal transduction histidine kinase/ActR/RegA family two-component response regulator
VEAIAAPAAAALLIAAAGLLVAARRQRRRLRVLSEELREVRELRLRDERSRLQAFRSAADTLEEKVRERTAELSRAYNELKGLGALKDAFIASVSHELRTPLSSIRAFSEILLGMPDEDVATRREFLEIINKESERLTRLIEDVLDLSRMEAGAVAMRREPLSLGDLARAACGSLGPLAGQAGLRLEVDVPDELPPAHGDADRVAQVLTNLVGNAVKFTPPGGAVRVSARAARVGDAGGPSGFLEVRVSDTGVGIPAGELQSVFEKFKQVGNTLTGKPRGTGLGLPICREIVQRLGGHIWAESAPGRGSTFLFTLPTAPAAEGPDGEPRPAPPHEEPGSQRLALDLGGAKIPAAAGPPAGGRTPTIGVADDDPGLLAVVSESLRVRGFEVIEAGDGRAALELARRRLPDLLILDLQMPEMSGWQVLEALRADPATAGIPVIVLTGWALEGDRIRALSLGAVEYLQKGQGLARLCAEIDMATRGLPDAAPPAGGPSAPRGSTARV